METIIGFTGASTGDSLAHQTRAIGQAFAKHGFNFVEIPFGQTDWSQRLMQLANQGRVALAFSFAGAGGDLIANAGQGDRNLWDIFGIPFFRFQLDTPAYFPDRHLAPSEMHINYYWFAEHLQFHETYVGSKGLRGQAPAWPMEIGTHTAETLARKRTGKVIFLKNGNDPAALRQYWRTRLPEFAGNLLNDVADDLVSRIDQITHLDIPTTVEAHLASLGMHWKGAKRLIFFCCAQMDDFLRRHKSTMIVESLADLPIEVWGHHWEHIDYSGRRGAMRGGCDYSQTSALMDEALAVIDMSPNTTWNPHDRILKCAGRGNLFLSNEQQCLTDFGLNDLGVTFRFDPESIRNTVEGVLADPEGAIGRGQEASRRICAQISDTALVMQMIALADLARLAGGQRPEGTQPFVVWPPNAF